jgi:sulfur-carrier protein
MATEFLYFAWVREKIGTDRETLDIPDDVDSVAALIAWLASRSDRHAEAFSDPAKLRAAVDQSFAGLDAPVQGAKEIALFPPVTGG